MIRKRESFSIRVAISLAPYRSHSGPSGLKSPKKSPPPPKKKKLGPGVKKNRKKKKTSVLVPLCALLILCDTFLLFLGRETGNTFATRLIPPSHCETPVALCLLWYHRPPLLHPTSFRRNGLSRSKGRPWRGASQKKLASEAYRAIGGIA